VFYNQYYIPHLGPVLMRPVKKALENTGNRRDFNLRRLEERHWCWIWHKILPLLTREDGIFQNWATNVQKAYVLMWFL